MLNFEFTDINDRKITLTNPVLLTVNMEENVPAFDMSVCFEYEKLSELTGVTMSDDEKVLFVGVVDEQIRECSKNGDFLKIVCRSMAAKLLDNESVPISYTHPSKNVILKNHIKDFSVMCEDADDDVYFSTLTVPKGSTNWQAIEDFSKGLYNTMPYVDERGVLRFSDRKKDSTVVFSNLGDGIKFFSFTEHKKRCEEISKVRIKATNSGSYNMIIKNKDACDRKIQRERYINAVFTNTPAIYAQDMINNSKKKSYLITLSCAYCQLETFLCGAKVVLSDNEVVDNLYVCALRYDKKDGCDVTTVTLKKKG